MFDETHHRYALMQVGWDNGQRIRGNLIYITLKENKCYIEYNGMEQGIIDDLIQLGIPENQIILAFINKNFTENHH